MRPTTPLCLSLSLAACLASAACAGPGGSRQLDLPVQADVPVTRPPYEVIYVEFKETLGGPEVFVDHVGPYNDLRAGVDRLLAAVERQDIEPAGPIFVRFLDDPRAEPHAGQRAEIGLPVPGPVAAARELQYAVAEPQTVVYAVVSGPFGSGRVAYPGLDARMAEWGWQQAGPVKESYLFPEEPGGELLTEVQIPWVPGS